MFYQLIFVFVLSLTLLGMLQAAECPELTGTVILSNQKDYEKSRLVSSYYTSKTVIRTQLSIVITHKTFKML
jgi:hypothetical protein